MPNFWTDGSLRFVSYITGPKHVRLGLRLAIVPVESPLVVRMPAIGDCAHGGIDETLLVEAVRAGILNVDSILRLAELAYVANDTADYSLYSHCATLLARDFLKGQDVAGPATY